MKDDLYSRQQEQQIAGVLSDLRDRLCRILCLADTRYAMEEVERVLPRLPLRRAKDSHTLKCWQQDDAALKAELAAARADVQQVLAGVEDAARMQEMQGREGAARDLREVAATMRKRHQREE